MHQIRTKNLLKLVEDKYRDLDNLNKLSKSIGKHTSYMHDIVITGKRTFSEKLAKQIEQILELPTGYLSIDHTSSDAVMQLGYKEVHVPFYEVKLSAGNGCEIVSDEQLGTTPVSAEFIKRRGVKASNLVAMRVSGDSMNPKILDGSEVIIDQADREIILDGKIYAYYTDECVAKIKRLFKDSFGSLIIRSDNPNWNDEIVKQENLHKIHIIGRVIRIINDE